MKKLQILGALISIIATTLTFIWFDWKMVLVMFLFLFGNNLETNNGK